MSDAPQPEPLRARRDIFPLDAAREAALRLRIVSEARSWVGTPYRQLGATKGIAVDCCMLIVRVLIDAGVVEDFDPRPYPPLWFFHRDDERYLAWIEQSAIEVRTPQPGDIAVWRFGRAYSHSGIILGDSHVVHAFAEEGKCTISPLHQALLTRRPRRFYSAFPKLREQEGAWPV